MMILPQPAGALRPWLMPLAWLGLPLAMCLLSACSQNSRAENNSAETLIQLPVTTLSHIDTVVGFNYVADIQALRNVEIRARVNGFLEKICVDEGQLVRTGDCLFRLSTAEFEQELQQAKANLLQVKSEAVAAELEVKRVQQLVENNIISKTELELAQSKLALAEAKIEQAKALVSNAKIKLSYTEINAPFEGIIDRIPLKQGSVIEQGSLLTSVSDNSSVFAYFNLSESEYLNYRKILQAKNTLQEDSLSLTLADGSRYPYYGKIETIEADISSTTGSIAFRARFPNPKGWLRHGATGRVTLFNENENVLVIPQKAVFELQDKNYVFVLAKDSVVHMKPIRYRARLGNFYIISEGLAPGETIVIEGLQNIQDGMKIRPAAQPFNEVIKTKI